MNDFDLLPQPALGDRLRRLRLQRGLKQSDLATNEGLSTSYISRIESGNRSANLQMVQVLANRLGVDVSVFQVSREAYLARLMAEGQRALTANNHAAALDLFLAAHARSGRSSLAVQWTVRSALVVALCSLGRLDEWAKFQKELVDLALTAADPVLLTEAYVGLSSCERQLGNIIEAYAAARSANDHADDAEVTPDQRMLATITLIAAESETGRAFDADRRAGELMTRLGDGDLTAALRAQALWAVASVDASRGRSGESSQRLRDAVATLPTGEDPVLWARLRLAGVSLSLRAGRPLDDETRAWFVEACGVLEVMAIPVYLVQLDILAARIAFAGEQYEDARDRCEHGLERADLLSFRDRMRARMLLARAGAKLGGRASAIESMRGVAQELDGAGARDLAAEAWRLLAEMALDGPGGK